MQKQKHLLKSLIILTALLFTFTSCKKDETSEGDIIKPDNRVFIVNEGPFQTGSGSLSIYYRDTKEVEQNAFYDVNDFSLGNLVQSLNVFNDKVYIVVNNAGKVEVADKSTLQSSGTIEGINLPRYFVGVSETKAYVSSWDNKVYIVNLPSNTVSGKISTATGPEKMLKVGETVWVLNQGGFGNDSIINIIDINTDQVAKNIEVASTPSGIVADKNNNIWVICSGKGWNGFPAAGDTEGALLCIDPDDYSILKSFPFPTKSEHPQKLVIDNAGQKLYYLYPGGLYAQDVEASSLEMTQVMPSAQMFYALGFDPVSELVFVSDPLDFSQDGMIYRIDPNLNAKVDSFAAGVIPDEFYFN